MSRTARAPFRHITLLERALWFAAVLCCTVVDPAIAPAAHDCSQPQSNGDKPQASDCLFILRVAVGLDTCTPKCFCAPKGTLPTTATDALVCLKDAVGSQVALDCPCVAGPVPPPTVEVDDSIVPEVTEIPGFDEEPSRPVTALTDDSGILMHFVENEFIVVSDDLAAVTAFATQIGGEVVRSFVPQDYGLSGSAQHLIRFDPLTADTSHIIEDLQTLTPNETNAIRVASDAGLGTLAVAARETATDIMTGLNVVMQPQSIQTGFTTEAASLPICAAPPTPPFVADGCVPRGIGGASFVSDAFQWSYMGIGAGTQNIGVTKAWEALSLTSKLGSLVKIAVIDGGFSPGPDVPTNWEHHNASISVSGFPPNAQTCSGGAACPWHGANVVNTATGLVDNSSGAAGPAGPIASLVTIRASGDVFNTLDGYGLAFTSGARILNMSYGARVPATLAFAITPFDIATREISLSGMLLLAAAGNDNSDVDAEDCVPVFDFPCWEKAWQTPCENGGVTCIGALADNATTRRFDSNYGASDVDLFGPGHVWVGADPADPEPHDFNATSAATPFVAGVAALVIAANPGLTGSEVAQTLIATARPSSDSQVRRYVNANAAVLQALGAPPVCEPPRLIPPPNVLSTAPCIAAVFNVTVRTDGPTLGPYTYRWRRYTDDVPVDLTDGGRISGSHTSSLTIDPFLPSDAGTYDVEVDSPCGASSSGPTLVRVVDGAMEEVTGIPQPIALAAMAFDSGRGRMVLYGGEWPSGVGLAVSGETWERDSLGNWEVKTQNGPSPRFSAAMAYDEARGVTVLFGGYLCSQALCSPGGEYNETYGDTWEWDGDSWTEVPVVGPPARMGSAMTYDPVRQRVVLFGGVVDFAYLGDLWEFDGTTWTERATSPDPTNGFPVSRSDHGLVYDRSRNVLVLHGGMPSFVGNDHGGTWELANDGQWAMHTEVAAEPSGLYSYDHLGMVFDTDHQRTLLASDYDGQGALAGTLFEWDGNQWTQKFSGFPWRTGASMAYDSVRKRATLVGGSHSVSTLADVWEWHYIDVDPTCGMGP